MDYSKNIEESEKSDLQYAKWYESLSDEKKAQFFKSGYDFVTNKIRYDLKTENPFAGESDVIMRFIELTQKEDYSAETYEDIKNKMAERSELEWKKRFKKMKKSLGWSYDQMAVYMGAGSGASVKASVNRQLPAFAKLAVCLFEKMELKDV